MRLLPILIAVILPTFLFGQSSGPDSSLNNAANIADGISGKQLRFINDKYNRLVGAIDKQTTKMLARMQRKEAKLQNKMQGVDSTKAQQLFANTQAKYQQLQAQLQSPVNTNVANPLKQYSSGIDSMQTLMHFLSGNTALSIPADKLAQIQGITVQVQQLQARMQQANEAQQFIQQREQQLKDQLSQYKMGGPLLGINKEVYYYRERLAQYKELINDKEKLEEAVFAKVRELPAFQNFMQKNSILAQLFPMPQNYGTPAALAGLQSRAQVQGIISQRLPGAFSPSARGSGTNYLQSQLSQAQTQINTVKDKVTKLGGGSSDMTMPDFVPNSQKTKPFLKRLQAGFNFQSESATTALPAITDLGLTLGYKFSDKATAGMGASYKLGLGRGLSHIAFTSQGLGIRSFADIKAKGSIWITTGYEYNYLQQFVKLSDLSNNIDVWQKSALLGITKKYKIGKQEGNMQLLYDFLAVSEVPRGQALKFRFGYCF